MVSTVAQLNHLLHNLGHLLDVLVDAELQINTLKSAFLIRFTPGFAAVWKKRHLQRDNTGLSLRFRTPAGRLFSIPVKEERRYLGLIISYHDPVSCSIAHRLQAAWTAWGHLRPMLTSANAPCLKLRLKLWLTCLPAVLLYGLHTLALSTRHVDKLQAALTRQLRALARSPVHLSRESTEALHSRLRVKTVGQLLHQPSNVFLPI